MKNNSEYMKLVNAAREKQLTLIQKQYEEIRNIYKDVAKDLSVKSNKAKQGSLTQGWLKDYQKAIQEEIKQLDKVLYMKNKEAVNIASEIASNVHLDFLSSIDQEFELGIDKTFKSMFSKVPNEIHEILNGGFYKDDKSLASRIWTNGDKLNKDIQYMINKAIAEKKSAYDLAKDLESYINPDAKKDFQWKKVYPNVGNKKVDYNAQRLARTSINHAYFMSNHRSCEKNPFIKCMHWELSNSHYERQVKKWGEDICDQYSKSDDYGLGVGNYPIKGSDRFPHPSCLCVQYAIIPDSLEAIGTRLGNWINGSSDSELDSWYQNYGLEFAINKNEYMSLGELAVSKQENGGIIKEKELEKLQKYNEPLPKRHRLLSIGKHSTPDNKNTIILPHVDYHKDIADIKKGLYSKDGTILKINGRSYSYHDNRFYPEEGEGLVTLNRGQYKLLKELIVYPDNPYLDKIKNGLGVSTDEEQIVFELIKIRNREEH